MVRRHICWSVFAVLAGLAFCAQPARAALLLYESFSYSGTGLNGQGGSELGMSGSWTDNLGLSSGTFGAVGTVTLSNDGFSLGHPGLQPGLGSRVDDAGPGTARRDLNGFTINNAVDGVFYVSALIRGSAMVQFQSPTSAHTRAAMGVNGSGQFVLGQQVADNGSSSTYDGGEVYDADETYLLVGRITTSGAGNEAYALKVYDSTMAIDPTDPVTFDVTDTGGSGVNNTQISLAFFSSIAGQIDEIRVGTTWADVTPVPEPSTWAMAGVGLLGLAIFQRRRRKG